MTIGTVPIKLFNYYSSVHVLGHGYRAVQVVVLSPGLLSLTLSGRSARDLVLSLGVLTLTLSGQCAEDDLCPVPYSYGTYLVPVMLGVYVMFVHVLLLNLIIARFK